MSTATATSAEGGGYSIVVLGDCPLTKHNVKLLRERALIQPTYVLVVSARKGAAALSLFTRLILAELACCSASIKNVQPYWGAMRLCGAPTVVKRPFRSFAELSRFFRSASYVGLFGGVMEFPVRSLEELAAGTHERKGLCTLGAQVEEWVRTIGYETDSNDALLIWNKATELMLVDPAKAAAFLSLAFPAVIVSAAMRYKLLLPPPARTDPACEARCPWLGQPYTGRNEGVSAMGDPGVPRRRLFGDRDTSSSFDCTDVVAVLGGSFNPIVSGHLAVAAQLLAGNAANEVWLLPCGTRPDKPSLRTSMWHRYMMTLLAVESRFAWHIPIRVVGTEMFEPHALSSAEVFSYYRQQYPHMQAYLPVGADIPPTLHLWRDIRILLQAASILVLPRPGYDTSCETMLRSEDLALLDIELATNVLSTPFIDVDSSSTGLRQALHSWLLNTALPALRPAATDGDNAEVIGSQVDLRSIIHAKMLLGDLTTLVADWIDPELVFYIVERLVTDSASPF